MTGNLLDVSGNGIVRPTIASAAYAGRHTANHSMNISKIYFKLMPRANKKMGSEAKLF